MSNSSQERLEGSARWIVMGLGAVGLLMTINQTFALKLLGFYPIGNAFIYYLIGLFLSAALLIFPARKADTERLPWYDWVLAGAALGGAIYLGLNGLRMTQQGWEYFAPLEATLVATMMLLLVLEGVRRCGGWAIFAVALLFGLYPLYAGHMPVEQWLWLGGNYSSPCHGGGEHCGRADAGRRQPDYRLCRVRDSADHHRWR